MKIAVYAIAKNESANVERWCSSVAEADGIFVLDTGSTDDTVEKLKERGVVVNHWPFDAPFRFDKARNLSLEFVPHGYDVCVSLDFDEILVSGWRNRIAEEFVDCDAANYTLIFDYDADGRVTCSYPRLAIHRRDGFQWHYAVHEVLVAVTPHSRIKNIPTVLAVHMPKKRKEVGHYLPLLKLAYQEEPDDPRVVQYLAREYYYMLDFAMAIPLFKRHITLEKVPQFRSESARFLAYICTANEELDEAERWYLRAISECTEAREPLCELSLLYFETGQYESCIGMIRSALRIVSRPQIDMIFTDHFYTYWPYHLLSAAYYKIGNDEHGRANLIIAAEQCGGGNLPAALLSDLLKAGVYASQDQHSDGGSDSPTEENGDSGAGATGTEIVPSGEENIPQDEQGRTEAVS